ncbi:acyl-CoA synthetase [Williamsia sp. CHRR-6]|uniref:acyl-CoA synthetase n=1 Tax=Williamsia sp. CHRR-6 TaxID=2835871 RepID=UPI001BDA8E35|nr:acyl-CoA synthetase [Williamsia sp. CHRR-6]MBT0565346.1 acyl-CoA synthetase [Williamsia sp. CHRR-6]
MLLPLLTPAAVAAAPDDTTPAVTVGDQHISRADLVGAATATAERLGAVDRVAVEADASLHTVVAVVAALIAGVVVIPIPPDSGPAERDHVLNDSGARLWVGSAPADARGRPHLPVRLYARSFHRHPAPGAESPAMLMYTSGTTGRPKGVVLSHGALAAGIDALAQAWAWTESDTLVHGLPLFHVHGLILGVLGPLRIGSPVVHTVRPTPEKYAAAGGSIYFGVPTVWSRVAAEPAHAAALRSARLLVSGSAPLPTQVFESLRELTGHEVVERYGMTETLITVSARADGVRRAGWVGTPLAGVSTKICDEHGTDLPHDGESIGQLFVRGPMLGSGYYHQPEATAQSWCGDGWFATGDVAAIDADASHRIVGRMSTDLIKTGGFRVGAGEVESVLRDHDSVGEVAVVGVPDPDLGQRIVAFVVPAPESQDVVTSGPEYAQSLIDHVAQQLSVHKRPREVRVVDDLPRNAMGKVRKNVLLDQF